jgi:hypothetical protein
MEANNADSISISDVDKDQEAVYVHFDKAGKIACSPIENRPTVGVEIYVDENEPVDHLRVVDMKQEWDLRRLDDYFHERVGRSLQDLITEEEQLAREIGRWFITHYDLEGE